MSNVREALRMMRGLRELRGWTSCAGCKGRLNTVFRICCRRLCETCFFTIVDNYNGPPVRDIFYCPYCGLNLTYVQATAIAAFLKGTVDKFECRNDQVVVNKKDLLRLLADKWGGGLCTPAVNGKHGSTIKISGKQGSHYKNDGNRSPEHILKEGISENGCFSLFSENLGKW